MEVIGVGVSTKVERRIPIGEGVMVILMVSSMSIEWISSVKKKSEGH